MVVPAQPPRLAQRVREQVARLAANSFFIAEHGEDGIVQDEKFSFEILHPKDGVQVRREERAPTVGMQAPDASGASVRLHILPDVHRVLGHEDTTVRRGDHDARMRDFGSLRDQFHRPAGRGFGNGRTAGVRQTETQENGDEREVKWTHEVGGSKTYLPEAARNFLANCSNAATGAGPSWARIA